MKRGLIAAASIVLFCFPAMAQQSCGLRDEIVTKLQSDFQERRKAVAVGTDGSLLEFFVSDAGSWSVIRRTPGSTLACLVAGGQYWSEDATWSERQETNS